MKKIVIPILVGSILFVSNYALADGDPLVKLRAVKVALKTDASKYIDIPKFINKLGEAMDYDPADNVMSGGVELSPFVTLSELSYACLNSVLDANPGIYINETKSMAVNKAEVCYKFLIEVVRAHNKDVDDTVDSDNDLTDEDKIEFKEMFKVDETDIKDVKPYEPEVREWSFTMFKPNKSTKKCESNGFYLVERLNGQPLDGFEFRDCYFESGTDRIACCQNAKYKYGSKEADYCESYYFQKRFSGDCVVGPVILKDYFEGSVNEWAAGQDLQEFFNK